MGVSDGFAAVYTRIRSNAYLTPLTQEKAIDADNAFQPEFPPREAGVYQGGTGHGKSQRGAVAQVVSDGGSTIDPVYVYSLRLLRRCLIHAVSRKGSQMRARIPASRVWRYCFRAFAMAVRSRGGPSGLRMSWGSMPYFSFK